LNIGWGTAEHLACFLADGEGFARANVFGNDGRLPQDDAFAADVHEDVRGA